MAYHNLTRATRLSPPIDTTASYDPSSLSGKTILITGGATGLGALFARHWAANGAHLAIGDINDAAGEELVADLRSKFPKGSHHFVHCDVTDWDSQAAFFTAASRLSPHGGIDVVVANAGFIDGKNAFIFEDPKADAANPDAPPRPDTRILDVNTTGLAYTAHLALFWLARNKPAPSAASPARDRCLLLMGSVSGLMPFPGQAQYCMSKHAVTGLFRALRGTAWQHGIRVNMLAPYFIGGSNMLPAAAEAVLLAGSAGPGGFDDVIDAATRLVADAAIVGRALVVGPRVSEDGAGNAKLTKDGMGIWECYAEDYVTAETFVWRWIGILNAVERGRGWIGWARDLVRITFRR